MEDIKFESMFEYYTDHPDQAKRTMFSLPSFTEGFTASIMGAFIGMMLGSALTGGNFDGGPIVVVTMTIGATIGLAIDLIAG